MYPLPPKPTPSLAILCTAVIKHQLNIDVSVPQKRSIIEIDSDSDLEDLNLEDLEIFD